MTRIVERIKFVNRGAAGFRKCKRSRRKGKAADSPAQHSEVINVMNIKHLCLLPCKRREVAVFHQAWGLPVACFFPKR